MDKIVVIGSNSFSGASFVSYCLSKGIEVLGISRSNEPINALLPYKWNPKAEQESFIFKQLDLNRDADALGDAINDFKGRYVFNFAAQSMVAQSWINPEHWYQTNVLGCLALHERLRKIPFLEKYIHISTPEIYGNCTSSITEDQRFNPSTPYAASRAACDMHLMTYFKQYKFPVVFTRAANVYGPGQQLYRIIPKTIICANEGKKIALHGGGHSTRSFIHIRDVAEATFQVAKNGAIGEAYHISTKRQISIRQLVEKLCLMMGTPFSGVVDIVNDRPGKDAAYILDDTKLRSELNWEDKISLEDGLQETIDWVSNSIQMLKQQPHEYIHHA